MLKSRRHGLAVLNDRDELVGVFTIQDLDKGLASGKEDSTIGEFCTRDIMVAYPDETIGSALRRMGARDVGRLPVVARDNHRKMVGMLRRSDLVRAYDIALTRRTAMRHRAHEVRLGTYSGQALTVEEYRIETGSTCDGKQLKDVPWPQNTIVASLRRGRRLIIPHGQTVLKAGDVLVAVAESDERDKLIDLVSNHDGAS
jgi:CIC family chloride channel protein